MFSFNGTNVLVLGAAGGIGRALAIEFYRRGARVVAADIDEAGAHQTAAFIREAGGDSLGLACDITDERTLAETVGSAEDFLGSIDISANAVGVLLSGNPEDIPLSEWERIFRINLFSAVRLNELVLPKMVERKRGYIVNTASVAGLTPFAVTRVPYAASKAALISMSENMAIYLEPKGVRVSCLCPGPTITQIGNALTTWTKDIHIVGPGSDYSLITPEHAARVFCDGMENEDVIIPSHPEITQNHMQRHAASPETFISEKIEQFERGDHGLPEIDLSNLEIVEALSALGQGT